MKDSIVDSIEMVEWLRSLYGDWVCPTISSVKMCQDKNDVWLSIKRSKYTVMGLLEREETMDLSFICDTPDDPSEDDFPIYTTKRDVFDNAREFCQDKVTIANVTSIFDKQ